MGNLNHLWSLSVEEHFYLFWPMLLIIAAGRRSIRVLWVLLMVTALMATSLLWRELLVQQGRGNDWNRLYSATDIRLVSPLLGAGLAVLLMRFRPTFAPKLQWYLLASFGVAGGYILIWLSTEPSITFGDDYWMTALPLSTISSLAICLAALAPGGPVVWLLNFPS